MTTITGDEMTRREAGFAEQVHDALAHLYDPIHLEGHVLVGVVPAAGTNGAARGQGGLRLKRWLLDAIAALEPDRGVPPASVAWRGYRLLTLRYVEALSPEAVQTQLGISRAQFFREHRRALDAVVSVLEQQRAATTTSRGADGLTLSALGDRALPASTAGGQLPEGTVTFLFTDVEGSTKLLEAHPAAYRAAVRRHHDLLAQAVGRHGGRVFETVGDAVYAAFGQATDAVAAAMEGQLALHGEPWGEVGRVRVRMAVHTGEAELQEGHYFGVPLYRCARLMGVAHGEQAVLSEATAALVREALPPGVTLRDLGLHRLKDLTVPERIYQLAHPALPQEFPPLRTLDALPHNLPAQSTPFLGREREVAAVRARLRRPAVRLLTLLGPGGTGKTRLALQVAAEAVEEFPQGVYFVPLAGISDSTLVASEIARALGVEEAAGRSALAAVIRQLRHRVALLVLDNCEHVVEGCVAAAAVLAACPHVKVLATSRVALRLAGEHEVQVPPLSVPLPAEWGERRTPASAERLSQYEAVRLFLDRAQAARSDFQISEENAPAVAEICYRLDGLPLAIELAAARVNLLPPHALLARLGHRLALLTSGARDVPARHQTLRAAIGWSYDLLSEAERVLFRRLAVFAGGWDLEAVAAVCGAPEAEAEAVEGVAPLLEKNLIKRDEAADGRGGAEPRYVMLETIREFAAESLRLSGEEAALRRLHAEHYQAVLRRAAEPMWRTDMEAIAWVDRLAREHDNLRAALRWLIEQGEAECALAATEVLFRLWERRGYFAEGRRWLEEVLALPGAAARTERRAVALNHVTMLMDKQGQLRESVALKDESIAISKEVGELHSAARKLQYAGYMHMRLGDMATARARSLESAEISRSLGLPRELAWRLQDLALFARHERDLEAAARYAAESRDAFAAQEGPDGPGVGWGRAQGALAHVALLRGDHAAARQLMESATEQYRRRGAWTFMAGALELRVSVELAAGNTEAAWAAGKELLKLRRARGEPLAIAESLETVATVAAATGESERALRLLGAAEAIREALGAPREAFWWEPVAEETWEQYVAGLLELPAAAELRAEGRRMGVEEAIACALEGPPAK